MQQPSENRLEAGGFKEALRFWEPLRIWYTAVLVVIVLLWIVFTWPHFRPALTWINLGRMAVLGLLANLCYCAAYVAEFLIQRAVPQPLRRRTRYAVWVLGLLLAMLLTNYWIADEIYPDVAESEVSVPTIPNVPGDGSNLNFPAPLAVVGFLAGCGGAVVAVASGGIFWLARKPKFARASGMVLGVGAVVYFGLLLGFSEASRDTALSPGQEKYFCEIDCHLAYAVMNVKRQPGGELQDYVVTLRTRFDEKTISPRRPKDAPLVPSPRGVRVIDRAGRGYEPVSSAGASLMTPLRPGESYETKLEFQIPKDASGLRLLINTVPAWPDRLVIGDENSWLHKKTYFAL